MREKKRIKTVVVEIITIMIGIIYVYPVLIVFTNTFKPLGEILKNPFSFPESLYLDNLNYVFGTMNYMRILWNTLVIAIVVVLLCILLTSMAGWMLTRDGSKKSRIITMLFLSSLLVPFQSLIIPIAKMANSMHINNTISGYIWIQVTLYAPMGIFMYQGFTKNVPISLEESARLDGANPFKVYAYIVFPLMKPITTSIAVLYSLWIWNDYLLASIMLHSESKKTITISIYAFYSMYNNRWDYAITAVALSIIPITIVYLLLQKYIISGITAGAVKG